jgi:hypothetical protein
MKGSIPINLCPILIPNYCDRAKKTLILYHNKMIKTRENYISYSF